MNDFFKNFSWKPVDVLKIAGLGLAGIIVIAVGFSLISVSFKTFAPSSWTSSVTKQGATSFGMGGMEEAIDMMAYNGESASKLSVRNVTGNIIPHMPGNGTTGDDAEEFEVTSYNALIETRRLEDTCASIVNLKAREDVIFENSNEGDEYCNYAFKVRSKSVTEILVIIEELDPKDLSENTYTIKNIVDDYTSEVDILEKKMSSIEETLANAISAYDDITKLATRTQDVESLAKIIDSKINIIERLTQEKINISARLERLNRSKAEQLDRLDYTYFNVNVSENKFIDSENLKDSWKMAVKNFVCDLNMIVQDITINLLATLFLALQYIIYFFAILIIIKYLWRVAKKIWLK